MFRIAAFGQPTQLGDPDLLGRAEKLGELFAGGVDVGFNARTPAYKRVRMQGKAGEVGTPGVDIHGFFQKEANVHRRIIRAFHAGGRRDEVAEVHTGALAASFFLGFLNRDGHSTSEKRVNFWIHAHATGVVFTEIWLLPDLPLGNRLGVRLAVPEIALEAIAMHDLIDKVDTG